MVQLTFLGTGTSTGIPVVGCDCRVCQSPDPRDNRLRASVLVRTERTSLLIDTSPDLREQLLRSRPERIDAVLFTHAHADHTAGLDELRRHNAMQQARIPVWATGETVHDLTTRFAYAFDEIFPFFGGKPDLDLHEFERDQPFNVGDVEIQPVPIMHGSLPIVGFRIGDVAYVTDVKEIPESSRPMLRTLDVLVLTALRTTPHATHLSLDEAVATIEELQPKRAFLTHISHEMGRHAEVAPRLPDHIQIATDGLTVTSPGESSASADRQRAVTNAR